MSDKRLARLAAEAAAFVAAIDSFEDIVEDYLDASGVSQTKFSVLACGQVDFVRLMRQDRDFRLSTARKVMEHIASQGSAATGA